MLKVIVSDDDSVVECHCKNKQAIEYDLLFAGHLIADALATLKNISIEAAAIEIMQAVNFAAKELSQEENNNE